jgi:hypothetical protein
MVGQSINGAAASGDKEQESGPVLKVSTVGVGRF